jgi:hypothetical protein
MTKKEGRPGLTGSPHAQPREPVAGDVFDHAIDETIRHYFLRHDPPARAYARLFEVARRPSTPQDEGVTFRSWIIGVSSTAAALLLVNVALQLPGATAAHVGADTASRGHLFLLWLSRTGFARWVNESETIFGYSGILFLHTFGLAVVVGVSIAIDLRLLGAASRMSITAVRPLFRYLWWGFCVNALSGAILFAADAPRKVANPMFELKLALVALGVAVMAVIERRLLQAESSASSVDSQPRFGPLAGASLLIWAAAIAAGRLVAYAF